MAFNQRKKRITPINPIANLITEKQLKYDKRVRNQLICNAFWEGRDLIEMKNFLDSVALFHEASAQEFEEVFGCQFEATANIPKT